MFQSLTRCLSYFTGPLTCFFVLTVDSTVIYVHRQFLTRITSVTFHRFHIFISALCHTLSRRCMISFAVIVFFWFGPLFLISLFKFLIFASLSKALLEDLVTHCYHLDNDTYDGDTCVCLKCVMF